jgi:hypothetical protein
MKKVKFIGHISKQGDRKRMIIIPHRCHEEVDKFGDHDLIVEVYHAFAENEGIDEVKECYDKDGNLIRNNNNNLKKI